MEQDERTPFERRADIVSEITFGLGMFMLLGYAALGLVYIARIVIGF